MSTPTPAQFRQLIADGLKAWRLGIAPIADTPMPMKPPLTIVAALFQRQQSLYEAIGHLLRVDGMTAEAMILARPLFEESVFLHHLSEQEESARFGHVLHYYWRALKGAVDAYQALAVEHPEDADEIREHIAYAEAERAKIKNYAESRGYVFRFAGDTEHLAKQLGRTEDAVAYKFSQQYVHGRALPLLDRMKVAQNGTRMFFSHDPDDEGVLPLVTTWATRSAMLTFSAVAEMFGWVIPPEVGRVLDDANELQRAINESPPGYG